MVAWSSEPCWGVRFVRRYRAQHPACLDHYGRTRSMACADCAPEHVYQATTATRSAWITETRGTRATCPYSEIAAELDRKSSSRAFRDYPPRRQRASVMLDGLLRFEHCSVLTRERSSVRTFLRKSARVFLLLCVRMLCYSSSLAMKSRMAVRFKRSNVRASKL